MEKIIGSNEKMGFYRPLDACLEPRAQSLGMGGAASWEAQESRLPSVFEQLTWQQVGLTNTSDFPESPLLSVSLRHYGAVQAPGTSYPVYLW